MSVTGDMNVPPEPPVVREMVTPKLVIGICIVAIGVILALDRLGLANVTQILRFWPVGIIAVGAVIFLQSRELSGRVNGVFVAAIGTYILLYVLHIVRIRFWELFWPFVLIMIGNSLIMQALRPRLSGRKATDTGDRVSLIAILSSVKRASHASRFRGGEISAFMGGGQLDLRQANMAPGEEATIDVFMMMSGLELFVPPNWIVSTPILPIMGGVEDKRLPPIDPQPRTTEPPRLLIRGFLMMAGIEIKS